MQYELILTGKFKKSLKLAKKRGLDLNLLDKVITMLQNDIPLEEKYRDHELKGKYQGFRECHIQPDWLLVYRIEDDVLVLTLTRTGTHRDLFGERAAANRSMWKGWYKSEKENRLFCSVFCNPVGRLPHLLHAYATIGLFGRKQSNYHNIERNWN